MLEIVILWTRYTQADATSGERHHRTTEERTTDDIVVNYIKSSRLSLEEDAIGAASDHIR